MKIYSLLRKATEMVEGKAIDECKQRRADPVQGPDAAEGVSGLFQALLGQAAELPQPRMNHRPETLDVVNVDAVRRNVPLLVDNRPVVVLHPAIRLETIGPEDP